MNYFVRGLILSATHKLVDIAIRDFVFPKLTEGTKNARAKYNNRWIHRQDEASCRWKRYDKERKGS